MSRKNGVPLIVQNHILPELKAGSKKEVLHEFARLAAPATGLTEHAIFEALFAREKLGTTGVGHGIAIPHARLENLDKVHGFFARLSAPVEFDAIDEKPVDLMFMLLAPAEAGADHLKALAKVSRMFRNTAFTEKLRKAEGARGIFTLLAACEKECEETDAR